MKRVCTACAEGCHWRALPHDFPPYDTVFDHWQRWQERGVWQEAVAVLGTRWREQELGRSRHVAIDRQGTLLAVHVCAANKADGAEAGAVMVPACECHPSIESFTADGSYPEPSRAGGARATRRGTPRHGQAQGTQAEPTPAQKGGFAPVRVRWRVERTFAWLGQCRLLSKE